MTPANDIFFTLLASTNEHGGQSTVFPVVASEGPIYGLIIKKPSRQNFKTCSAVTFLGRILRGFIVVVVVVRKVEYSKKCTTPTKFVHFQNSRRYVISKFLKPNNLLIFPFRLTLYRFFSFFVPVGCNKKLCTEFVNSKLMDLQSNPDKDKLNKPSLKE